MTMHTSPFLRLRALSAVAILSLAAPCAAQSRPDFNGDGYADVAVGVPFEDLLGKSNVGAVGLLYGGTAGITAGHAQLLHQDTTGVHETAQQGDVFGSAVSAGDFNGDGFDDIAIGVPNESVGNVSGAGSVHVLYGSVDFITPADNQLWHQGKNGVASNPQAGDQFGAALESGDFDNDGFDDLAIGVPGERVGGLASAGAVHILYGSANGLRAAHSLFLHQNSAGIAGAAGVGDRFGSALCAGDFNSDSFDDLAIGVPFDDPTSRPDAGDINVLYGSVDGLTSAGNQLWHQSLLDGPNSTEPFDRFGSEFATGDFDGDGFADLAVAAPNETIGGVRDNGGVSIIYGTASGLDGANAQAFARNNPADSDLIDESPAYASAIAAGDINGDGFDELVVGSSLFADVDNDDKPSGRFFVLRGTDLGLIGGPAFYLHEATDLPPNPTAQFGSVLSMSDYNDDGFADLIIGMPLFTPQFGGGGSGGIVIMLGSVDGLEPFSGEVQSQGSFGEVSETGDHMGDTMTR